MCSTTKRKNPVSLRLAPEGDGVEDTGYGR